MLPYPLAASLDLYRTRRDAAVRAGHLLDFFEASAAFLTCVLLAATDQNIKARSVVAPTLAASASFLEEATFGGWALLGEPLAKSFRRLHPEEMATVLRTTRERAGALTSKAVWGGLGDVRELRNVKSHTGQPGPGRDAQRLAALEASLPSVAGTLAAAFERRPLVHTGTISFRDGRFHNHVEFLIGQGPNPLEDDLTLGEPLEESLLYVVDLDTLQALALPPLLRLVTDDNFSHAVYFWSKFVGGKGEFVCRHLGMEPLYHGDAPEVRGYLDAMAQATSGDADQLATDIGAGVERDVGRPTRAEGPETAPTSKADADRSTATEPRVLAPSSAKALTGRALGVAIHELLETADPHHEGKTAHAVLELALAAGLRIGGRDPLTVVGSALKITPGFKRAGRGRWTWIPLDKTLSSGISGEALRSAALEVVERLDPNRDGLSVEDIRAGLQRSGTVIRGPFQTRTLWHALASPAAAGAFTAVGPGRFAPAHPARGISSPAREEPIPQVLAEVTADLDAALSQLDARIGRRWIGDQLTYFLADTALLEVSASESGLRAVVEIMGSKAPHVRGVIWEEVPIPGIPAGAGPIALTVNEPRSRAALIRLAAGAAALAAGHRQGGAEYERWSFDAVAPWIAIAPPFCRGSGHGSLPRATEPEEEWHAFWLRAMTFAGVAESPLRGRRPTKGPTVGTSGLDGIWASMRLDAYGPMATVWYFARRTTPAWLNEFRAAAPRLEAALGSPLVVDVIADGAVFVALRAEEAASLRDPAETAARALRRLTDILEPWTAGLAPNR